MIKSGTSHGNRSGNAPIVLSGKMAYWKLYVNDVFKMEGYIKSGGSVEITYETSKSYIIREYSSSQSWNKPAGLATIEVICIAGGGGAAAGGKQNAGVISLGGGGGASGSITYAIFDADEIPDECYCSVGAGGVGGAAVSANSTNGNSGSSGGDSSFGDTSPLVKAKGGSEGKGDGSGGSAVSLANVIPAWQNTFGGGAGASASVTGGVGVTGGTQSNPLTINVIHGGASGGGITSANAASNGGAGNRAYNKSGTLSAVVDGGTAPGGDGNDGHDNYVDRIPVPAGESIYKLLSMCPGTSGSGGASSTSGDAGDGGNGGIYGGAGGGGGAARNEVGNSGKGGDGANGCIILIEHIIS